MEATDRRAPERPSRDALAQQMARLLEEWGADRAENLRAPLLTLLAEFDDAALARLAERSATTGERWGYHPPDPVARSISRAMMRHVLRPGSRLENAAALEAARRSPALLLGNHLSFIDVNVLDYLLAEAGYGDVAERVTALVGPKVFAQPIRRLASLCFGTIKLAQSASRASGEAVMPAREVARLARQTIREAQARLAQGDHVLVFPEGSRSRSGRLERCLAAIARYLETPGAVVVPWGHAGSERLMPLDADRVHEAVVRVRIGAPVPAARLVEACSGHRQLTMDVVGFLIADALPEDYRGFYARASPELAKAHQIARSLRG